MYVCNLVFWQLQPTTYYLNTYKVSNIFSVPSVATPDADTESIKDHVVDNYNNQEIEDNILQEIGKFINLI